MLLIDAMARAREQGWKIGNEMFVLDDAAALSVATEAILDDLARRSGAKRAAVEAQRRAVEDAEDAEHYAKVQAEADAEFAIYEKWVADGEPASDPLAVEHMERKRRIQQAQFARDLKSGKIPMPTASLHIVKNDPPAPLLVSSAEFIGGFVSPEYLIDGMVQRRYFYSTTAQTGVGKTAIAMRWMAHVVTGRPLGDREVQQGQVLYFAGENPDDVRARWLVLTKEMGIDPNTDQVTWIVGAKDLGAIAQQIATEVAAKKLNLALVVVDTAAAYFPGDEENGNVQMGNYARQLRTLTTLPGGPCVVVLCHPTKNATPENMVPRGGGAFIAEVDGNLAVVRRESGLLAIGPLGKFRGDMSWSQNYEIAVIKDHPKLKDARGRQMNSVIAKLAADGTAAIMEKRSDADNVAAIRQHVLVAWEREAQVW
jgi:hypothetical protein